MPPPSNLTDQWGLSSLLYYEDTVREASMFQNYENEVNAAPQVENSTVESHQNRRTGRNFVKTSVFTGKTPQIYLVFRHDLFVAGYLKQLLGQNLSVFTAKSCGRA